MLALPVPFLINAGERSAQLMLQFFLQLYLLDKSQGHQQRRQWFLILRHSSPRHLNTSPSFLNVIAKCNCRIERGEEDQLKKKVYIALEGRIGTRNIIEQLINSNVDKDHHHYLLRREFVQLRATNLGVSFLKLVL